MTNPFEDPSGTYLVLVNGENQHCIWPSTIEVPAGWTIGERGSRSECLRRVEASWSDMRPSSLVRAMGEDS